MVQTSVPIAIVIGSKDIEIRPSTPGHKAGTRIEYAKKWMNEMNQLAATNGLSGTVTLTIVEGVAHDPVALTPKAQELLITE